ncbi:DUF4342 domain-containing protein [Tepidibacillus marianensis]|uniref:DUF4342 domain-containing protein n=1 Tax=Tepidibacillus marianensis TaxID=3131995 RepID=UPI0030D31555
MNCNDQVSDNDHYTEEVFVCSGEELKTNLIRMFKQTNRVQLTISKGNYVVMSVPITLSIFLLRFYPFLSLLTAAYLIKRNFTIKVQKIMVI